MNTISDMNNTPEGMKSRIDEAVDWISKLEDKVEKNPNQSNKTNKHRKRTKMSYFAVYDVQFLHKFLREK